MTPCNPLRVNAQGTSRYDQTRSALLDEGATRAELGGISRATLNRLRQQGELPVVRIGRRVMFTHRDVRAYIERHREPAP